MIVLSLIVTLLQQSKPADANVVKVYNLSSAVPGLTARMDAGPLLPYLNPTDSSLGFDWQTADGADTLVDLLRHLSGEEFDYEGRSILLDGHRLIVKAPAALQARTERFLAFLEGIFGASAEIAIDAVETPDGAPDAALASLIPVADVEKILARAGPGGVRSWRLKVCAGSTAALDLTRSASMVLDYNVEIAQGAAIADPIVEDVPLGTRILARAAPTASGLWLSLILRRGDPVGEVVDREIPFDYQVSTTERVLRSELARVYQSVDVLNRSLAFSTHLPEGKAVTIQSAVRTDGRTRGETLIIRRVSGSLPIFRRIALGPAGADQPGDVLFVNAETAEPPRCDIETPGMNDDSVPKSWSSMFRHPEIAGWAQFPEESFDLLRQTLADGNDSLGIRQVGACIFLTREDTGSAPPPDDPLAARKEGEGLDLLAKFAPPARIVRVAVTLRRGGSAAPLARTVLPLRAGEPALAVLGMESFEVADYDVEVAQLSSVADSQMRIAFDGLALRLQPNFALSGDLTLEVVARAHVRTGPSRQLDLGVSHLGRLDESTYDQLFARQVLTFSAGEGAPRRFVLGDSSANPPAGSLSLEVEASEVR